MMRNTKKCTAFLITTVLILDLTACGPKAPAGTVGSNTSEANTPAIQEDAPTADEPADGAARNTPVHINKSYGDSFSADVDVIAPDISTAHILTAKRMSFDEQKVVSVLFDGKAPQKEAAAADGGISYSDGPWAVILAQDFCHATSCSNCISSHSISSSFVSGVPSTL